MPKTPRYLTPNTSDKTGWQYASGDWAWYVENNQSLASGSRALFKASKGALGRQMIAPTTPGENLAATVVLVLARSFYFR